MRSVFFVALSAIATLAAAADENPFNNPSGGYSFTAGEDTTLTWDPTTEGTVTLQLQWGDSPTADSGTVIVSHLPNSGTYSWSVPSSIADHSDYTIKITSDQNAEDTNYLPRFEITGASDSTTTTTSATTTTTETTSTPTTTKTTTTKSTTMTTMSATPSPTSTTSSTTTHSTSTTETTETTSPTATPTNVPNTNGGIIKRASGGLMALAMGAVAFL